MLDDAQVLDHVGNLLHQHLHKHVAKISRVFNDFDTSGDGRVDKKEFRIGIKSIVGDKMTPEEVKLVWNFVDKDGGGTVDYLEFAETIRQLDKQKQTAAAKRQGKKSKLLDVSGANKAAREAALDEIKRERESKMHTIDSNEDAVEAVGNRVKKYLRKNMARAIDLFRKLDTSGDGYLDEGEMREGLKVLGLKMGPSDFKLFWKSIDEDGGGYVDTKELMDALGNKSGKNKLRKKQPSKKYRSPIKRIQFGETRQGSLGWLNQGKTASQKNRSRRRMHKRRHYKQLPDTPPAFIPTGSVRYKDLFDKKQRMKGSLSLPNIHDAMPKVKQVKRTVVKASKTQKVLRCIAMREGLIRQIYDMLPSRSRSKGKRGRKARKEKLQLYEPNTRLSSTGNLLFELKTIQVETVEAIEEWRKEQDDLLEKGESFQALAALRVAGSEPSPTRNTRGKKFPLVFSWNGQNYLMKMCTDLNFLSSWRNYLVRSCVSEIQNKYIRRKAMEIALESEDGNLLEKIPSGVIVKLLKQKENFQKLFDKHDRSGDGQLQRKELHSCFNELGIRLSPTEIAELFYALDRDGNGEVDTKELLRALEDTETAHVLENARFENVEDILREEWIVAHGGVPNRRRTRKRKGNTTGANEEGEPENEEDEEDESEEMKTELCRLMYHANTEHTLLLKVKKLKVLKFGKSRKKRRDKSKATMSRRRGE